MNFSIGSKGNVRILPVLKGETVKGHEDLSKFLADKDIFTGEASQIYADLGPKGEQVVLVGLGEEGKVSSDIIKAAFFKLGKVLDDLKVSEITIVLPKYPELCYRRAAMACAEGLMNNSYRFDKYLSKKKECLLKEVGFEIMEGKENKISQALEEIKHLMAGVNLTRNLVNEPAEAIYPETLAEEAKKALEPLGVEVEVLGKSEIEALGMTAFLAVARGSAKEPKLIVMRYKGAKDSDEIIGLVGKGLTYDSGGYAIKPAASMVGMHTDMGGSGAVIGAMAAIAGNKLPKNVTAVVAACENMISGEAYKNGDIIRSMSGKTIEIGNTDAEGRVTLADAIYYTATKENVNCIIDLATLTGAVIVALGSHYTGAVSNDQAMMDEFKQASAMAGEKVWQLPADDCYRDMIKGTKGDLKNSVKGGAGSITAGLFLENFVEDKKWIHLDIAGTAAIDSATKTLPANATGIPVKSLYYFVKGELSNHHDQK